VIRQAISCDICGTEKKLTNHWYVAYDQGGELRVSGFDSRNRLRPGAKHLCGQTCLHKLVDDFITRAQEVRLQPGAAETAEVQTPIAPSDTSLTSNPAHAQPESSPRLPAPPTLVSSQRPLLMAQPELVAMPGRLHGEGSLLAPGEPSRYASRTWRAEAWERERARELRVAERHPEKSARRRSG
jgi:hypothetical protein